MFEFHGWAVIRTTYNSDDDADDGEVWSVQAQLAEEIAATEMANHFHIHDGFNGMASMTVSGLRNHRKEEVIDIFDWLAENAPGSYGLLYVLDDEDPREENAANFRVFRLARGSLQELADPFLSPPVPVVEDPYRA